MSAIIRNSFRVYNARKFVSSIEPVEAVYSNNLYLGIGRPQTWVGGQGDSPVAPGNNIKDELTDWSDLMFMKRLFATNMCHAVPKRIWSANTVYDPYRHDWNGYSTSTESNTRVSTVTGETPTDLSQVPFYCSTPTSQRIFICLTQAKDNAGNPLPSVVSPELGDVTIPGTAFTTSAATGIKYCSDGYVWLELGNSTDLIAQFDTLDYYPVQTVTASAIGSSALQWTLQNNCATSYKGGIYSINVTASNVGYNGGLAGAFLIQDAATNTTHVRVVGDGTGVEYVVIYNSSGGIQKIIVTNPGAGYTWARVEVVGAGGTQGAAEAILTPLSGIGTDPVKTLGAYNLICQVSIYDDENTGDTSIVHGVDFTVDNDYRKIALISNVKLANGALASASKLDMTYGLIKTAAENPGIAADVVLTRTTVSGDCKVRVVDSGRVSALAGCDGIVRVIQTEYDAPVSGPNVNIDVGDYSGYVCTSVIQPDAEIGSGDVIYTDYRRPVTRSKLQSEEFKIVIEF